MVLKEELQYIGRTNPVGCPSGYEYYILVYAGAALEKNGHRLQVAARLACTADASFYGFATSGSASVGGVSVWSWNRRQIPESYWGDSAPLTEEGITYPRWTELTRGELFLDTCPAGGQLPLEVSWVMESSSDRGWFPNTGEQALGSFRVTLPPIAAAEPRLSAKTVAADGQTELFVTLQPATEKLTCRVDCLMGSTLMARQEGVTDSCAFTFSPESWLPRIPDTPDTFHLSDEEAPKVRVTTVDALGNSLGQKEIRFDITAPRQFGPLVTLDALTPVSLLPVPFDSVYLQKLTSVKAEFTALGQYGATVTGCIMTVEGKQYDHGSHYTSEPFTQWGNVLVRITATDSRGCTGVAQGTVYVEPYMRPVLCLTQWGRCDEAGNLSDNGDRLQLTVSGSCSSLSPGENLCGLEMRWKKKGDAFNDWTVLTPMADTAVSFEGIPEVLYASPEWGYVIQLRCRDTVGCCTVTEITLPPRRIYMHKTPNGLGLGKYVEEEELLDCGWNVWVRGSLRLGEEGLTLEEYIRKIIAGG